MLTSIAVSLILNIVTPVSGDIDRTDQRSQTADGFLRRTSPGNLQRIYIVDCGVTATADTSGRVVVGFTAPGLTASTLEHGTLMSSIAAGQARGLAPQATIIDIKVCDSPSVDIEQFKRGLDFLATQIPGVVNISLEWRFSVGNPKISEVQSRIATLKSLGFVLVVAAGNGVGGAGVAINDGSFVVVPAVASDAITVASVQYGVSDQRWPSSNFGPEVDFFAAATLQAVQSNGLTVTDTGTSGSTALTTGAIAAASSFGATSAGTALENFARTGAIWNTVLNGNSPNAARLFSDLGTVSQVALGLPQPPFSLFCGFGPVATVTTAAIASGPAGEIFLATDIRCPTTITPVVFVVEKRTALGAVVFQSVISDPNGSNSGLGESIRSLVVSPDGARLGFAVTSRDTNRFTISSSVGTLGGLDAYLI